ncbi:OmpA family protein [Sphaerisporangium sp. NPDC005288]|uniref:OmpA family protein n=1 Tax=Sphaerisporangium rhizosphaerae TaxID=2269375 RepID=A0ABW2NYK9_9ACTN
MRNGRRGALLLALVVFCVTGCGAMEQALLGDGSGTGAGSQEAAPAAGRCEQLLKVPTGIPDVTSVTVLLVDGSATSYTRGEPRRHQDWGALLTQRLPDAPRNLVAAGVFGGAVDWRIEKITPGDSKDAARTHNDRKDARACLSGELTDKLGAGSAKPQTDVLRAVTTAAQQIGKYGDKTPKTIMVATDGLSNTGCADLRAADIGDHSVIPGLVRGCRAELPQLDRSYTVQLIGIGNPADGWSDVKTPHRVWLLELWKQMCAATGANCPKPTAEAPAVADVSASATALSPDADVRMPGLRITPGNPTVITVPASILFDVDSARPAPRAQDTMGSVVEELDKLRYRRVVVAGHTDSTGSPDYNRRLSEKRAKAVLKVLRDRGITESTAVWYGSRKPACAPEYKNGTPDRVAMACNRRVEIIVYT